MNTKTTPKDFFLHLGATIALYASVVALINLAFSLVNYLLPDQLAGYFYSNSIAWPISMLVILVPTLYLLEWVIARSLRNMPDKKDIWIRKWRIYLTLFLSGATIIGDLITLINTYLNGEISARFIYKVLIVLVVTGVTFTYYLLERVEDEGSKVMTKKILAWAGIVIVLGSIVAGFVIVGTPGKQRNLRFDSQRVSDLSSIQWQVINYWQHKQQLPSSLNELNDPIAGYYAPTDPANYASYVYTVKGSNSFELCANFALSSQDNTGKGDYYDGYSTMSYPASRINPNDSWVHTAGRACFERTIDPVLYPPINSAVKK